MRAAVALVAAAIACGSRDPERGEVRAPVAAPVAPAPPPPRDCAVLGPAVDRITANEVAEIQRTRPAEVAGIATGEVEQVRVTLREALPALCATDAWSGAYTACMARATLRDDARGCQVHLTPAQLEHLTTTVAPAAVDPDADLPSACRDYAAVMRRFLACQAIPAEARQTLREALEPSMQVWRQAAQADRGASIAPACSAAVDALREAAEAMGCAL